MKFRSLKNWPSPEKVEGLLFFAQIVEELLFDYSMDTYKPSAMNSSTLCTEALYLIDEIDAGTFDESNLVHVIDELIYTLKRDTVARNLLSLSVTEISKKLFDESVSRKDKRTYIELIHHSISLSKYKIENERQLQEAVGKPKEKGTIRSLTRSYLTTLISIGYHYSYISATARNYFHIQERSITSHDQIREFFEHFPDEQQKYVAVVRAGKIFLELRESCDQVGIEIHESVPDEFSADIYNKNFTLQDEGTVYVILKEFEARDVNTARLRAQRILELVSSLASLFHHKNVPKWESRALLINMDRGKTRLVSPPTNPMLKCEDLRASDAATRLNSFINKFSMSEDKSFDRFYKSAELHSLALRFDAPENQLLNIWMALETIVPSESGRRMAKVNNIIEHLMPFIQLAYIPSLIDRLRWDIFLWDRKVFSEIVDGVPGETDTEKTARVLVLDHWSKRRQRLYKACKNFYLLRNRVAYLNSVLDSKEHIRKLLGAHGQRIEWQIRRIYRARNSIVHSGDVPRVVETLIENVHTYWDIVTNRIIQLASAGDNVNTLDQAFRHTELVYERFQTRMCDEEEYIGDRLVDELILYGGVPVQAR